MSFSFGPLDGIFWIWITSPKILLSLFQCICFDQLHVHDWLWYVDDIILAIILENNG